jgi:hypothetical protein
MKVSVEPVQAHRSSAQLPQQRHDVAAAEVGVIQVMLVPKVEQRPLVSIRPSRPARPCGTARGLKDDVDGTVVDRDADPDGKPVSTHAANALIDPFRLGIFKGAAITGDFDLALHGPSVQSPLQGIPDAPRLANPADGTQCGADPGMDQAAFHSFGAGFALGVLLEAFMNPTLLR